LYAEPIVVASELTSSRGIGEARGERTVPIRTFLFDLGNVLVRFSHERMYRQLGSVCDRSPEEIIKFAESTGLLLGYETGLVDNDGFHAAFEEWLKRPVAKDALLTAGSDIFHLNEPMDEVLTSIARQGYRLVLLSNTCPAHYERVSTSWEFLDQFDHLVLSYEVGAMKPSPKIYQAALKAIECEPSECLYTDDIAEYVYVGKSHGLHGVVFQSSEQFVREIENHGVKVS
jgi:putative hydrolase of the HAD superfamily